MLNVVSEWPPRSQESRVELDDAGLDPATIKRIVFTQWPVVLACAVAMLVAAFSYLAVARPLYTAATSLLIDTRKNQFVQGAQAYADPTPDAGMIESQVEILRSESVALSVIRELKLTEDRDFLSPGGLFVGRLLKSVFGGDAEVLSEVEKERQAVAVFQGGLSVRRVALTYVLEISYASPRPELSARIANAVADAYMVGELDAKYQATKRASRWLQERIQELRLQAQSADQAVQKYKTENDIIGTNRGLMSDQQLGDVNAQLVTARATTAEAKARLDRIQDISRGNLPDATVTDALRNEVITRLRAQYLDLSARESDWSVRYGPQHTAVQNLRNQLREIRRSIAEELNRIAETYKSDYEIAKARELSVETSLSGLVGRAGETAQAQVNLRDLESSAQTARNLYDTFLQRSMEATQSQSFPVTDARIITVATTPAGKSHPKSTLILGAALGLGLLGGVCVALVRGRLDDTLKSLQQLHAFGHGAIGVLPIMQPHQDSRNLLVSPSKPLIMSPLSLPSERPSLWRYAIEKPLSRAAEALRSVKVEFEMRALDTNCRVIGVTSSLPREGKSTIACNFAELLASSGRRTLLIDGDLRNPSLSMSLTPEAERGLPNVLVQGIEERTLLYTDPYTGMEFLPALPKADGVASADLISSQAMGALLQRARADYDVVVIDLPPSLPIVDVRATSHNIDGFVFVAEWGKTTRDTVQETFRANELLGQRLLGFLLNKAPMTTLKRYEKYKGHSYGSYYA